MATNETFHTKSAILYLITLRFLQYNVPICEYIEFTILTRITETIFNEFQFIQSSY